jgi:hypothetical protein
VALDISPPNCKFLVSGVISPPIDPAHFHEVEMKLLDYLLDHPGFAGPEPVVELQQEAGELHVVGDIESPSGNQEFLEHWALSATRSAVDDAGGTFVDPDDGIEAVEDGWGFMPKIVKISPVESDFVLVHELEPPTA